MRKILPSVVLVLLACVGCGDEPTVFEDVDGAVPVDDGNIDTNVPETSDDTSAGEDTRVDSEPEEDAADAPTDSSASDGATVDSAAPDTLTPDTISPDTFVPDTFVPDTFVPDTAVADTRLDGAVVCSTVSCTTDGQCALAGCGRCLGAGKCGN